MKNINLNAVKLYLSGLLSAENRPAIYILAISSSLMVAWPVSHSIAIRNILLALLLFFSIRQHRLTKKERLLPTELNASAIIYLLLSCWLLIAVLFSDNLANSLSQYRGEWIMGSLSLIAGLLLGSIARERRLAGLTPETLFNWTLLALGAHSIAFILYSTVFAIKNGHLPLGEVPLLGRTSFSFTNTTLYYILLADCISRLSNKGQLLKLPNKMLAAALALTIYCTYLANTRNGTLCTLAATVVAAVFIWAKYRHTTKSWIQLTISLTLIALLSSFTVQSMRADARWQAFIESSQLALDTEHNKAWLDSKIPLPLMSNGQPVDHSAYMRLAWFKEGVLAAIDYPFGVGYGRNAFGHALTKKYGQGRGHSHSSLIDFTLSGGIPGIALWLIFSINLMWLGWKYFRRYHSPYGLALTFLIGGTLLRMIIDSNLRDHGLEQYLFLLAIFAMLAVMPPQQLQTKHN